MLMTKRHKAEAQSISPDAIVSLINEMVRIRRPSAETAVFQLWRHNDELCPKLERRTNSLLDALRRHSGNVYDVQGLRDDGADVYLKSAGEPPTFICFQVKSQWDFDKTDVLQKLKAQYTEVQARYHPLQHYYIVLCVDPSHRGNKEKLRTINAALGTIPRVTLIQPECAIALLRLSDAHIDAIVKSWASPHDASFEKARHLVNGLSQSQQAVAVLLAWRRLFGTDPWADIAELRTDSVLEEVRSEGQQLGFELFSDTDREIIAKNRKAMGLSPEISFISEAEEHGADIDSMAGGLLNVDGGRVSLDVPYANPLLALVIDGVVRYEHKKPRESVAYVLSMLR
jgi:hypothetical protein